MASVLSLQRDSEMLETVQDTPLQTPVKRLTMVERARLEALAAFGNEDFNSLSVKKDDFRTKLKSSATKGNNATQSRITRLERAKREANSVFKNINLGQKTTNTKKRKFQENNEQIKEPKKQSLTRLQRAKVEVDKAFENVSLGTIPPKKSRIEKEKMESRSAKKVLNKTKVNKPQKVHTSLVEWNSPCQPRLHLTLSNDHSTKRLTRSQSAKLEAMRSSEGTGSERLVTPNSHQKKLPPDMDNEPTPNACENVVSDATSEEETSVNTPSNLFSADGNKESKRPTRLERAKLETFKSFSGQHLEDICKQSTKIVAKYLEPKKHLIAQAKEQNIFATPVPSSHKQEKSMKSNPDVYSSITEGNFKDQTSLLETSKRVIETAVLLETPEASPVAVAGK